MKTVALTKIEVTNKITGNKKIVEAHSSRAWERLNHENKFSFQSAKFFVEGTK